MKTLAELKIGERATISRFTDDILSLKLIGMGCLPGESVKLQHVAPLGCPIAIEVSGYLLSMRRSEASTVIVN
jgi:ferrous iron transport protein A